MKRMGMVIGIKPERIAEYKKTHAAVWPEVLAKISDCNMRNYTIFLREPENLLVRLLRVSRRRIGRRTPPRWRRTRRPRNGGPFTSRCRRRSPPAGKATGGQWRRRCFTTTEPGTSSAMSFDPASLRQSWPAPSHPKPIVTIGAGSIVVDAHFPAYRKAGFPIAGVYDLDAARARSVADKFGVAKVFGSLDEALATKGAIFDLATPPGAHASVLERVPVGAGVLIQKPMGADLGQATRDSEDLPRSQAGRGGQFPVALRADDAGGERRARSRALRAARRCRGSSGDRDAMGSVRLSERSAARRDRGAFDPLSRSHPRLPRRSRGGAREDDRPSVFRHGPDPHDGDSRLWRPSPLGHVDQSQPRASAASIRSPSSVSMGLRARRTPSSGFSLTIRAANQTNCGYGRRARRNGSRFLCEARGFPTLSSAEWRTCSVSAPARTPC